MWSKMAASEVCHERFTANGPETKKKNTHTDICQQTAISDEDTVVCTHYREALSDLGSTVCFENQMNRVVNT